MTKIAEFTGLFAMLAVALALCITGTVFADADVNGCPSLNGKVASKLVGGSFTFNGNTATYTFDSFTNEHPVNGVPGLIEYFVYPTDALGNGLLPGSVTVSALGDNGVAWVDPQLQCFSFSRPNGGGNNDNIGLDGASDTMGTATWSGSLPANQTILLHINDAAECDKLYGGNPGTCFVLPCPDCTRVQLPTVSKTANPSFEDKYSWTITKAADKTIVKQFGGSATFNYTVTVGYSAPTAFGWQVAGTITVSNPNAFDIIVDITDAVDNGGACTVTDGTGVTVPGGGSVTRDYTCTYSSAPNPPNGTNTATAGGATGTATFDFGNVTATGVDDCVTVTDSLAGTLGTVCVGAENPTTFTYSLTFPVPQYDCQSYTNTATFTTNSTGATGSASQTVKVCGPAKTGALTMGFWQNRNGQAIIKNYCGGTSGTSLYAYLTGFHPFSDLTSTTCTGIGTYVYNVIKAANASGASMNAMLKAQMLATALDAYFSDPTLGGNLINAPYALSGKTIDLTLICATVVNGTCLNGITEDASFAFSGATSLTVGGILAYQNTSDPLADAGAVWYSNGKPTQELAKDTFDAINNQVAFDP